ncbi:MAG: DsrE/DsrF/DrsH-like family protein, partial [Magnetococcus sp. WYHC-3]
AISTHLHSPPLAAPPPGWDPGLVPLLDARLGEMQQRWEQRFQTLEQRLPGNRVSIVVFSGDMDRVLAAMVLAHGALALGMEVSLFFTFWGLAGLKRNTRLGGKSFRQQMLTLFLPRRSEDLGLSRLNMLGLGSTMMKSMMRDKHVASLEELRDMAVELGARMIGCTMAMDLMGVTKDELIDGVELGGVAAYMDDALHSRVSLFL